MARNLRVDFSILDLHLRGMTGIQVLETFARLGRPLPSIMMSGQASQEETAAAMSAGAFTFLRKPLDLKHLLSTVDLLIRQRFGDTSFPTQPHP